MVMQQPRRPLVVAVGRHAAEALELLQEFRAECEFASYRHKLVGSWPLGIVLLDGRDEGCLDQGARSGPLGALRLRRPIGRCVCLRGSIGRLNWRER